MLSFGYRNTWPVGGEERAPGGNVSPAPELSTETFPSLDEGGYGGGISTGGSF